LPSLTVVDLVTRPNHQYTQAFQQFLPSGNSAAQALPNTPAKIETSIMVFPVGAFLRRKGKRLGSSKSFDGRFGVETRLY
jgi:hypothetical protein